MIKNWIAASFMFSLTCLLPGQDTIFNQHNSKGQKTGYWKVYYENGRVKYTGYFVNDKPTGELNRYYPGGIIQAHMIFERTGTVSRVKLYDESGNLSAEGKYYGNLKDSVWNFYSSFDGRLAFRETYEHGRKDGLSSKYYPNGTISETVEWKNDLENGKWEQYYENGDLRLKGSYLDGMRQGDFRSFHPGGKHSVSGAYKNGTMDGKWIYFDENGKEDFSVDYVDGKMLPNEEFEKRVEEFSKKIKEIVGDIPEPSDNQVP